MSTLLTENRTSAWKVRKALLAPALVVGLLASLITAPISAQADGVIVDVPDGALADCLASALDLDPDEPITQEGMALLTVLDCSSRGISDIAPLRFAINAETLDLSSNAITDATFLTGLSSLTSMTLAGQTISAVSAQSGVPTTLPAITMLGGHPVPLTVSPTSGATGPIVGNEVTWQCAGEGKLQWDTSMPFGMSDASAIFSGVITQEVVEGPDGPCALSFTPTPTITGALLSGQTLSVVTGTWDDGVTLSVQWYRSGVEIEDADAVDYLLTDADLGSTITVAVTGQKPSYGSVTLESAATATIGGGVLLTATPTVTGTATVGDTLTAHPGTWTAGTAFAFRWLRNGTVIPQATAPMYRLSNADAGSTLTVEVTGALAGYTPVISTSAATAVINGGTLTAPTPTISGTPRVGQKLTAKPGVWAPTGVELRYQWKRGGAALSGATSSSYTLIAADAGQSISVEVTGTKTGFGSASKQSAASVVEKLLTTTTAPTVSGTGRVGQTLTANIGSWAPATVTMKFQWKRDGVAIAGATGRTYVLTTADAGASVIVVATGSKSGYTSVALGSAPVRVERLFTANPTPTISGTARVGSTLTATAGTWSPATVTLKYQWKRGGVAIAGATSSSYKLVAADAGTAITVTVTGSRSGYTTVAKTSAARSIEKPLTTTPSPTVSGTARVGQTLTASAGTWAPGTVTLKFQWKRGGVAIAGATLKSYKLVAADAGKSITVTVTGSRSGYTSVSKTSTAKTVEKLLTATPTPTLSGTARVGQTLKATSGTWTPATVTLKYQWKRAGVAISGATTSSYKLVATDAGKAITVTVTGSRSGYTSVSKTSAAKTVEKLLTAAPVPTISGKAATGNKLTVKPGTWGPGTVSLSYQWQRNGVAISGATASSYVPSAADIGTGISVVVKGSKSGYTTVSKTSARTAGITLSIAIPGDSTYLVGSEIAAGTYVTSGSTDFCYWERVSGFGGSLDEIISNDIGYGQRIVTIDSTDVGFETSRCGTWIRLADLKTSIKSTIPDYGVLSVAKQVKPGLYRAADGSDGCYWATLSSFDGDLSSIIDNDYTDSAQPIFRVPASAVAVEVSGCGIWTRIGD